LAMMTSTHTKTGLPFLSTSRENFVAPHVVKA